jgi:outer membrane receptor protein involved in Fe transport
MKTLAIRKWLRRLGLPLLTAMLASPLTFAQTDADDTDEAEAKELDRVVITGSRIARTATEGPSPVVVIDREQIEREGFTTVEGALKSLTQATGVVQNELFAGGFTQNANALDLRGLGPGRTLVLVDGRRVSDYPLAYNGQSNIVNISAIPLAAVDRIEVMSGGASAIYGSDAIAGVVNIIMRRDFGNSIDMNVRAGTTDEGGMDTWRFQAVGGFLGKSWNMTYAFEYLDREPLYGSDRAIMSSVNANPDPAGRINTRNSVEIDIFGSQVGFPTYVDPGDCDAFSGTDVVYSSRPDPLGGDRFYCGSPNWVGEQTIVNGREQVNLYLTGTLELGQSHEIYADFNYFQLDAELDTGFKYYFNQTPAYIANSNSGSLQQFGFPGAYGQVQRIFTDREIGGRGAQNGTYDEEVLDYAVGIRGDFFSPLWRYDVFFSASDYNLERERTLIVEQRAQDYFFTSWDDTIPDPFGFGYPTATLNYDNLYTAGNQGVFESLTDIGRDGADTSNQGVLATINGDLFDLPAGPLGVAFVAEWFTQDYQINLDERLVAGDYFWGLTGTGGGGERDRYAAGIEFNVPVTSWLTMTAAGRYDEYDDITQVEDATTYNLGLQIRPNDKILLRGTIATTFRAPDMHYVFADPSGFFTNVTDEYLCQRDEPDVPIDSCTWNSVNISGARQGNPLLQEEEGETITYGLVIEPTEDMYFSIDYWDIDLEGLVVDNPITRILEIEADCRLGRKDPNSGECIDAFSRITRNPDDGSLLSEQLDNVNTGPVNAAQLKTKGIDSTFEYTLETASAGLWGLQILYSHVLDTQYKVFPEDDLLYIRGDQTRDWRSRVRGSLNWAYKDLSMTLFGERFGSSLSGDNVRGVPGRDIGPQMYYNLTAFYNFLNDQATVGLIVNNLFDNGPPEDDTATGWPYFDLFNYGFASIGREYYVQFRYRFDY